MADCSVFVAAFVFALASELVFAATFFETAEASLFVFAAISADAVFTSDAWLDAALAAASVLLLRSAAAFDEAFCEAWTCPAVVAEAAAWVFVCRLAVLAVADCTADVVCVVVCFASEAV